MQSVTFLDISYWQPQEMSRKPALYDKLARLGENLSQERLTRKLQLQTS